MNIKELREMMEKPIWHWLGTREEVEKELKELELKEEAQRLTQHQD